MTETNWQAVVIVMLVAYLAQSFLLVWFVRAYRKLHNEFMDFLDQEKVFLDKAIALAKTIRKGQSDD